MTSESRQPSARALSWWLALCFALYSAGIVIQLFPPQRGIDFYHFWGIAAAHELAGDEDIGTPYVNGPRYAALLNAVADASQDRHLKQANGERRSIDPTGTPFFYMCFAGLPADYSKAHSWFRGGQWLCLAIGLFWFARRVGVDSGLAALFATAIPAFFYPFHSDLLVGNVNAYQLLACVAIVALAGAATAARGLVSGSVLAAALVAFVVFKPNLAPISLVFLLALWNSLGLGRAFVAGLIGLAFGAVLVAISSAYFGGLHAWSDWYAFLSGPTGSKVADYPVSDGNYAPSVVFVDRSTHPDYAALTYRVALGIGVVLALSWCAALAVGRGGRRWIERLREVAAQPELLMTSALLFTLAASPLVWFHYCVLALLPVAWCLRPGAHSAFRQVCGSASLVAYGCLLAPFLKSAGYELAAYGPYVAALAWLPMWAAVLVELARPRAAD
ncbi:MAG: hypothetical protein IT453_11210 [Planctomycetes bacterium]|nr:hypothetical protein [Planctomycetota bacterium]